MKQFPANIYMFKVNNRKQYETRKSEKHVQS